MVEKDISDIHFKADSVPALRVRGSMILATNLEKMSDEDVSNVALQLMTKEQAAQFERDMELDLAFSLKGVARFRVNVYRQKGSIGVSLRVVPVKLRSFEELNLPVEALTKLGRETRGLILFAGITGAGKTTTLNSFLSHLNNNYQYRIISIEDPIEFFHADHKSTIVQREVGLDTHSFSGALRRRRHRRDARSGDDAGRDLGGRNRPPGAVHDPHDRRDPDRRPHRGHASGPPAWPGAPAAGELPEGRGRPAPGAVQGRQVALSGHGSHDRDFSKARRPSCAGCSRAGPTTGCTRSIRT
jgi:hypothetical protein